MMCGAQHTELHKPERYSTRGAGNWNPRYARGEASPLSPDEAGGLTPRARVQMKKYNLSTKRVGSGRQGFSRQ